MNRKHPLFIRHSLLHKFAVRYWGTAGIDLQNQFVIYVRFVRTRLKNVVDFEGSSG